MESMSKVLFLVAVPVMFLCYGEATAQLTLNRLYPDREVSSTIQTDGNTVSTPVTGTMLRLTAKTPRLLERDRFLLISHSNATTGMVTAAEPVGKFSIVGAVMGTLVAGSIGYLIVHADDQTNNFWEIGPLVVVPAGVAGFFLGGAIGGIITKPRPRRQ
jgi:hypothetical protein